jgi:hypothetical protein
VWDLWRINFHMSRFLPVSVSLLWCWTLISIIQRNTNTSLARPLGFQESEAPRFQDNRHMKVARLSALSTSRLYPPEDALVLISVRGRVDTRSIVFPEGLYQRKIPETPTSIEPATFLLVAQCFNQLRHCVPRWSVWAGEVTHVCSHSATEIISSDFLSHWLKTNLNELKISAALRFWFYLTWVTLSCSSLYQLLISRHLRLSQCCSWRYKNRVLIPVDWWTVTGVSLGPNQPRLHYGRGGGGGVLFHQVKAAV